MERKINYLYFGGFFLLTTLFVASSIFHKSSLEGAHFFFFLYALGQLFLETAALIFLGVLIETWLGRRSFFFFIGTTFVLLIFHFFDFLMERILDLSIWQTLDIFVFSETLDNFIYLLEASGIAIWIWIVCFSLALFVPFLGMLLYSLSMRFVQSHPLHLKQENLLQTVIFIPLALLFWDIPASKAIHPDMHYAFRTSLPFKQTFITPEKTILKTGPLNPFIEEKAVQSLIAQDTTELENLPNIYLFVVESLRSDVIQKEIAPNLVSFKKNAIEFDHAFSGGNGTDLSWFSIFHSEFAFFKKYRQDQAWHMGSPALNLLKKWGYKIHVYTSAQLKYYNMGDLLFGKNEHLLDSKIEFLHEPPLNAAESDTQVISTLTKNLKELPELQKGQVFIIFLDGTHFDYSWPSNWSPKFTPHAKQFAYFRAFHSKKTLQMIKNKYLSAVHYMDHLFGSFLNALEKFDDAILIFTADHGEEFFDQGHLFHNSHLAKPQIDIPLFLKFGSLPPSKRSIISQLDIFPSILNYLSSKTFPFLKGKSLLQKNDLPYAVTSRFNAAHLPYEFSIQTENYKLISQFKNKKDPLSSNELKVIQITTLEEERVRKPDPISWIKEEFEMAIKELFQIQDTLKDLQSD